MSTLKVNNIEDLDGNEQYTCKAWVNFDGTTTPPTIRGSGNVSSVVRNGTGDYTVNFTNSMVDGNYSANITAGMNDTINFRVATLRSMTVGSVSFDTKVSNSSLTDATECCVAIFR